MEAQTLEAVRERPFTVGEYFEMAASGVIAPEERVELLDGKIIEQMRGSPLHAYCTRSVRKELERVVREGGASPVVVVENHPIVIPTYDAPQPDVFLLKAEVGPGRHPEPEDLLLVVEVSVTSLRYDREVKLPRYAAGGIAEVWIVNVEENVLEIYRDPRQGRYRQVLTFDREEEVPALALPASPAVRVNALFPKK